MKKKYIVLLSILGVVIFGIAAGIIYLSGFDGRIASINVSDVDLSQIADGTYDGAYSMFPVSAIVKVTVKNRLLTNIELVKHVNGQGSAAEVLPGKVVDTQSLIVDTVTGATASSKVILKAIEDALENVAK